MASPSEQRQQSKISAKILFSYLSILLIPLCAVVIIYSITSQTIVNSEIEKSQTALSKAGDQISHSLEELNHLTTYISYDYNVTSFANNPYSKNQRIKVLTLDRIAHSLPDTPLFNSNVKDLYILFTEPEIAVRPATSSAFRVTPYNYEQNMKFSGVDYPTLKALEASSHNGSVASFGTLEQGSSLMLTSIPPNALTPKGVIIIELAIEHLVTPLKNINVGEDGGVVLIDENGQVLYSSHALLSLSDEEVPASDNGSIFHYQGKPYVVSQQTDANGWRYISYIPKEALLKEVAFIRYIMLALALGAAIVGVIISFTLWKRRSKSYREISKIASSYGINIPTATSEHAFIKQTVQSFWDTVGVLHSTVEEQGALLLATTVQRIIQGEYESLDDVHQEIETYGVDIMSPYYYLLHVRLPNNAGADYTHSVEYRVRLNEILRQIFDFRMFFAGVDSESFVILLLPDQPFSSEDLSQLLDSLRQDLLYYENIAPDFVVSSPVQSLEEIPSLYTQVRNTYFYMEYLGKSGILLSPEGMEEQPLFHYPVVEEVRLLQLLKQGRPQELQDLLQELMEENFEKRALGPEMSLALGNAMRNTVLRALRQEKETPEIKEKIQQISAATTLQEIIQAAMDTNQVLHQIYQQERISQSHALADTFRTIVEEEYSNPDFTLHMVAQRLEQSDNMVYQNFKTALGLTFSDYLEKVRIEKACQHLSQQVPVGDVAHKVGYASDQTFRRAFKRSMQILPSQYAAQHKTALESLPESLDPLLEEKESRGQ